MSIVQLDIAILKQFDIFQALEDDVLKNLINEMTLKIYDANEIIVKEGDYIDSIYFIIEGTCAIFKYDNEGREVNIVTLKTGNYLGELGILTGTYRNAAAKALITSQLLKLPKTTFLNLMAQHHTITDALLKDLSNRLVSALQLITGKEKNCIVLLNCTDERKPQIEHFLNYFKQISPKPICIIDGNQSELNQKNNDIKNHFILFKNYQLYRDNLANTADYVVNFNNIDKHQNNHFSLAHNATTWQIEHFVRRITNKTIGIALCSGGVPGIAHVGVLNILKKQNIPIDYIVGTSIGSICGACYAFNYPLESVIQLLQEENNLPLSQIMQNLSFDFTGFTTGKHYEKLLRKIFGDNKIEESLIPFAAVASDLLNNNTVIFKQGSVVHALRASCSVPLLFKPVKHEDQLLIDGVATAPLPIQVLEEEKIDIKIAVPITQLDLHTSISKNSKLFAIYLRTRSMMAEQMVKESSRKADVIIAPKVEGIRLFNWKMIETVVQAGEVAAKHSIPLIRYLFEKVIASNSHD